VLADITEENTYKMLSFLRFVEWDADIMMLVEAKMRDEKTRKSQADFDDDIKSYKAENISVMSISNELKVLGKLKEKSLASLAGYPNTLEEDNDLLAKDDEKQFLTFNQRNCVLFRKGEKEILNWFIELVNYCSKIMGMKWKEAKRDAN
jgi:hypothetical protein